MRRLAPAAPAPALRPHTAVRTESREAGSDAARAALGAEQWDRFVEATPGGDLIQTTAWAAAKRGLGFETCHVEVRRQGEIVGGALLVIKRFGPLGGVGYVARGPLAAPGNPEAGARALEALEQAARARRVRHLIVQPPEHGEALGAALAARGFAPDAPAVAPSATLRIDLRPGAERILAAMSASRRSQVRRGLRRGIEVRRGGGGDLDLFHRLHACTARRQRFTPLSRAYLQNQWDALAGRGSVRLFFADHAGRTLAGIWLTAFGDTVTYRLPGWSGEGTELFPNVACHWGAIQWAGQQGYRSYDLGGIERRHAELILAGAPIPDQLWQSHATFKAAFGAEVVLLPTACQHTLTAWARPVVNFAYARLRRYRWLDPLISRWRNG